MTACGAIGALTVGGRVVGQLRCELEAGHNVARELELPWRSGLRPTVPGTPHAVRLEWAPEAEPDLDLFDPDERFDVEVEIPVVGPCAVEGCVLESGHDGLHEHYLAGSL